MVASYSLDVRKKVVTRYEQGEETQSEISDIFGIHISTFKRFYQRFLRTGSYEQKENGAGRPRVVEDEGVERIKSYVISTPDITLKEIQARYKKEAKTKLSLATICRILKRLDLRRKKKVPTLKNKSVKM